MSLDETRRLIAAMRGDRDFARGILRDGSVDEVAARARSAGYDITAAEAAAIMPPDASRQLSDTELDGVAGGGNALQKVKAAFKPLATDIKDIDTTFDNAASDVVDGIGAGLKDIWDDL